MKSIKKITGVSFLASCMIFSSVSVLFAGSGIKSNAEPEGTDAMNVLPLTTGVELSNESSQALLQEVNFVVITDEKSAEQKDTEETSREELYPDANLPVFVQDEPVVTTTTAVATTTTVATTAATTVKKTTTTTSVKNEKKTTTPVTTTAPAQTTTAAEVPATEAPIVTTVPAVPVEATMAGEVFDLPTVVNITPDEYQMLCYVVQGEAGGASTAQLRAVVHVVVNRVLSSKFPNTIAGVLTAPNQFSTIKNYYSGKKPADDATKQAIYEVLCNLVADESQGALYFYYAGNGIKTGSWFETKLTFLYQLGTDRFFK